MLRHRRPPIQTTSCAPLLVAVRPLIRLAAMYIVPQSLWNGCGWQAASSPRPMQQHKPAKTNRGDADREAATAGRAGLAGSTCTSACKGVHCQSY
jgi:hypothetical protein